MRTLEQYTILFLKSIKLTLYYKLTIIIIKELILSIIIKWSSRPIVTDNNPKAYEDPVAPLYITVGTGGAILHKFKGKESYVAAQYLGFGFLDISITNNSRNLTGTFYESSDGTIEDHFTVIK